MNKLLLAGAAALLMTTGVAMAQTTSSSSQTTTTVAPATGIPVLVAPPVGTLSVSRTTNTTASDGTQTSTDQTTYRNSEGVANESVTRTTTYPPPPLGKASIICE